MLHNVEAVLKRAIESMLSALAMFTDQITKLVTTLNSHMFIALHPTHASQKGDLEISNLEDANKLKRVELNKLRFEQIKANFARRASKIERSVDAQIEQFSGTEILRLVQKQRQELAVSRDGGFGRLPTVQPWMTSTVAPSLMNALHFIT